MSFHFVMPTNLYGPNTNYNLEKSHVQPVMIRKFHLAKLLAYDNFEGSKQNLRLEKTNEEIVEHLSRYTREWKCKRNIVEVWNS